MTMKQKSLIANLKWWIRHLVEIVKCYAIKVCGQTCLPTNNHISIHMRIHTLIHIHTKKFKQICIYTHIYIYKCTHVYGVVVKQYYKSMKCQLDVQGIHTALPYEIKPKVRKATQIREQKLAFYISKQPDNGFSVVITEMTTGQARKQT